MHVYIYRQTDRQRNFVTVILRAEDPRFQSYSSGVRSVVERRARVRRVSGSIPGRSSGRMFLSGKTPLRMSLWWSMCTLCLLIARKKE